MHSFPRAPSTFKMAAVVSLALCVGCAGPVTPFGALSVVHPQQAFSEPLSVRTSNLPQSQAQAPWKANRQDTLLELAPRRQILHRPFSLDIRLQMRPSEAPSMKMGQNPGPPSSLAGLFIRYNGVDVTKAVLQTAHAEVSTNHLVKIRSANVRLSPHQRHSIEVIYFPREGDPSTEVLYTRLDPPVCHPFSPDLVSHLDSFQVPDDKVAIINRTSLEMGFNPTLFAALLAQESGFHHKKVSWARALGAAQITPLAAQELASLFPDPIGTWPTHPLIQSMPLMALRMMVDAGMITSNDDWRLDFSRSTHGGLAYLHILAKRWSQPQNRALVDKLFGANKAEEQLIRLILASYNSGYQRVLSSLHHSGMQWEFGPELREAHKYVQHIFSYCDAFTQEEESSHEG